jgi:kynurenine aminotransferase
MPGGKIVYVPLHPPPKGAVETSSAADWTIDFEELSKAITPRTKMIVINTPHNPIGKVLITSPVLSRYDSTIDSTYRYSLKRSSLKLGSYV